MNPYADITVYETSDNTIFALMNIMSSVSEAKHDIVLISSKFPDTTKITNLPLYDKNKNTCYCAPSGDEYGVSWPSTLPYFISIGGTTLQGTDLLNRNESTWNNSTDNPKVGSGCGYSLSTKTPVYQKNVNKGNRRCVPDVVLVGSFYTGMYIYFSNKNKTYNNKYYIPVGGTGLSCSLFAGMLSIATQGRFNSGADGFTTLLNRDGSVPTNNLQSILYNIPSTYYDKVLYGITGKDFGTKIGATNSKQLTLFPTKKGYDIPTGLGSINCDGFIKYLNNDASLLL